VLSKHGSLFVTRPTLAHYVATREELEKRSSDLFSWAAAGKLKVHIGVTLPLAEPAARDQRQGAFAAVALRAIWPGDRNVLSKTRFGDS